MKRILILCVCMIGFLSADWKRVMGSSDSPLPPEKEVMKSDTLGVFIKTAVFGFNEQDTTVDNKDFKRIAIPEESIDWDTINAGKPQIPYIRLLIAVPDSCDFDITVYESDYTLFEDYLIYPIPHIVFEETSGCFCSKEVYTYDASFYQKDTLYPGKFYEVNSNGHWRDQRVLELFLYPVQFNPGQELMYFYTNFNLRIDYTGEVVENENGLGPFEDIGREILLNYPGIDQELPSRDPPAVHYYTDLLNTDNIADYIIVTHEDFLEIENDSFWIHEFAQWRVDHNQFDVGIVKMNDVYEQFDSLSPDSAAQLRDFLIYAYNNWHGSSFTDDHFAYCLFIGDWDYVPTKLSLEFEDEWLCAYEGYFRDISSPPDTLDDIMLGRWPVKGVELSGIVDLITIAQKTINYEKYPDTGDWRRRGLLIAGGDWNYPSYEDLFDAMVTQSTLYFSDINYDTLTVRWKEIKPDQEAFKESIDNYLNHGEIITVYYDHGAPEGWWVHYDTSWVKELVNGTRLPVVLSAACLTAMFQWDHPFYDPGHSYPAGISLGEHFLINPDGGAVAFYGSTKLTGPGILTFGRLCLERLLCYQHWTLGKIVLGCKVSEGVNWSSLHDCCLLGDPALDLGDYTAYPDLPDLVVRPQGIDISLEDPYPYPTSNDIIPIRAKVFNIGAAPAYNVDVRFEVVYAPNQTYTDIVTIDEIGPRCSVDTTVYWNTGLTHPDFYGEIGDCEFIVTADPEDPEDEITESWEYNNTSSTTKKVALYPNEPGWSKKMTSPVSQPAIADLDGVGSVEIVVAAGLDSVYVFDASGNLLNDGWPQYFDGVHSLVLGDVDNNDLPEIIAVSKTQITVYDYLGNVLDGWPVNIPHAHYKIIRFPSLGLIDDISAYLDIIVVADPPMRDTTGPYFLGYPLKILVYDYQGNLCYDFDSPLQFLSKFGLTNSAPSIANVNSDNNEEIIVSYTHGTVIRKTDIFNRNGFVQSLDYGSNQMTSALVDVSNPPDGIADVITGGEDGMIRAYDAANDILLWERQTEGPINCSPAVGDIHPGLVYPGVEIIFGNDSSRIHLREKDDGYTIDPWPDTVGGRVRISPAIANISGDKYLDIMIGANNGYIYAFKHTMERIAPYPLPLFGTPSSPVIGDIDGDRKNEVILSSSDGYLHVWENRDTKVPPYSLEWPQFHHDYQRTGVYGWVSGLRGGDANPKTFSTGTTLSFSLKKTLHTKIKIYDAEANLVKNLVNQTLPQGTHNPIWFGKDDNYTFLPNGIYFIEIKVKNESKLIPVEINR